MKLIQYYSKRHKKLIKFYFIAVLSILLVSCSSNTSSKRENTVTVASFNIEWLGDGKDDRMPRTEGEYKRLAKIIAGIDADVIACEEIENTAALERIVKYLDDYSCYVEEGSGSQNLGVIYKTSLNLKVIGKYAPVAINPLKNRPGLELYVKSGNFDFSMMIVHLKSTSRYDNTEEKRAAALETRQLQAAALSKWVDSCLKANKEQDYIILGDFNDAPLRDNTALTALIENSNITFLTENTKSCGRYSDNYTIDNIVVSKSALKRCYVESLHLYDFTQEYTARQLESISDHCPVIVQFDIGTPDND